MKRSRSKFIVRWLVCSFSLWIAAEVLATGTISYGGKMSAVVFSGFVLALINTFIRPLVVFLTLPAVLLSLGIFMVVINGLMVMLAAKLYGPLEVEGFGTAMVAGLIVGVVNWLLSTLMEEKA